MNHLQQISPSVPQNLKPLLPRVIASNVQASCFKDKEATLRLQSLLQSSESERGKEQKSRENIFQLAHNCYEVDENGNSTE